MQSIMQHKKYIHKLTVGDKYIKTLTLYQHFNNAPACNMIMANFNFITLLFFFLLPKFALMSMNIQGVPKNIYTF